jgi:hypothetical protein
MAQQVYDSVLAAISTCADCQVQLEPLSSMIVTREWAAISVASPLFDSYDDRAAAFTMALQHCLAALGDKQQQSPSFGWHKPPDQPVTIDILIRVN